MNVIWSLWFLKTNCDRSAIWQTSSLQQQSFLVSNTTNYQQTVLKSCQLVKFSPKRSKILFTTRHLYEVEAIYRVIVQNLSDKSQIMLFLFFDARRSYSLSIPTHLVPTNFVTMYAFTHNLLEIELGFLFTFIREYKHLKNGVRNISFRLIVLE